MPNFESLPQHYIDVHQNWTTSNETRVKNEHQETVTPVTPVATATPLLCRCEHCGDRFELYKDLEEHYISQHQDQRRAMLTGFCKLCYIVDNAGYYGVGLEEKYKPGRVKPFSTYQELQDHYISVHWRHKSSVKKEILANRINLSF
jgi:hypothetical protein